MIRLACVVVLALLLCGCLGLSKRAPLRIVALPAESNAPAGTAPTALTASLLLARPQAAALLDSPRILARRGAHEVAHLAGVVWPDTAPRWLQDALLARLQPQFRAVERAGEGLRGDWLLNLSLQRLELDYRNDGPPMASIAWQALLLDAASGEPLASRRFVRELPAHGRDPIEASESLLRASLELLDETVSWVRESVLSAETSG